MFRGINSKEPAVLYQHSLGVCADLAVGGLFAYYALNSWKLISFLQNLHKNIILAIYILGFAWMMYGTMILNDFNTAVFFRFISTLFFVFVILEQNFCTNSFYKFSKSRVLSWWGKYTYGLYLLHPIAILIVDIMLRLLHIPYEKSFLLAFSAGVSALGISLVLSYISYEYFEKRFLMLKDRFSIIYSRNVIKEA